MASIFVTGASTGIGAACVARLDALGHRVFGGVRGDEAAERLSARSSSRVVPVQLDVTEASQLSAAGELVGDVVGTRGLDGLVNNAGIALGGPVEFLPLEEWRTQLEVNVLGQVAVTQQLLRHIRAARGRIVFIGSVSGRVSTAFGAPYGASKHAIAAVAQSLRQEVRPWGIKVSLVEPGMVRTPIWDKGVGTVQRVSELIGPDAMSLYGPAVEGLEAQIAEITRTAPGPERTVQAVEHALFHRRPRPRYPAGGDARAIAIADRVLPDRAFDYLLGRTAPSGTDHTVTIDQGE